MSKHSTATYSMTAIAAAIAAAASGELPQNNVSDIDVQSSLAMVLKDNRLGSGSPILFYNHADVWVERSMNEERAVDIASVKMQLRYQQIERSFQKHMEGFPVEKLEYVKYLANALCRLPFVDNLSVYNDDDESIDTILRLSNGLKLSISQFLDEDKDAPIVFSIHRQKVLLVSDELPMDEIVETLIPLLRKQTTSTHA